jgi:spore coat protein U-like protein
VQTIHALIRGTEMNLRGLLSAAAVMLAVGLFATPSFAQRTSTGNLLVQANLMAVCTVKTSTLDFGNIESAGTATSSASINVQCDNAVPFNVTLGNGLNFSTSRRLKHSTTANFLEYSLFRDAARTLTWGPTTANGVTGTGTGVQQSLTVYGSLTYPEGAALQPGTYADTVTITVHY